MKLIVAALFALALSFNGALAQAPCIIVNPTLDSDWPIGSQQLISWINANFTTIPVFLDDGSSSNYHVNYPPIISSLPAVPNSYVFTVPSTLAGLPIVTGTYAIQFGIAPNVAYGGPVIITAGNGAPPPPPPSTAPAVSGSVKPSNASAIAPSSALNTSTPASSAAPTTSTTTTSSSSSTAQTSSTPAPSSSKSSASTLTSISLGALFAVIPLGLLVL